MILDKDGTYRKGPAAPPSSVPKGTRLSVRDVIALEKEPFTMKKGLAAGELLHDERNGRIVSVLTVIGTKVEDVVLLRTRMLEVAGVKKLNYLFPELPDLKSAWQRFQWFIYWLAKGQS
jgi:hypothetical protein